MYFIIVRGKREGKGIRDKKGRDDGRKTIAEERGKEMDIRKLSLSADFHWDFFLLFSA
jgi:hypothetical protein